MNNKMINVLMFIAGVITGSMMTKRIVESSGLNETGHTSEENEDVSNVMADPLQEKPDLSDYISQIRENGYVSYSDMYPKKENKEVTTQSEVHHIISPESFGEFANYEQVSLKYYADNVLTDENNEIIENVDDIIGIDSLNHFGEYEDDSVFVRNIELKCDYEILKCNAPYSDKIQVKTTFDGGIMEE